MDHQVLQVQVEQMDQVGLQEQAVLMDLQVLQVAQEQVVLMVVLELAE